VFSRPRRCTNLTVRDVDRLRGSATLGRTKNGKIRQVTLPPLLIPVLRDWIASEKLIEGGQSVLIERI
jgi:integrase